jgi:hypothetical protein
MALGASVPNPELPKEGPLSRKVKRQIPPVREAKKPSKGRKAARKAAKKAARQRPDADFL